MIKPKINTEFFEIDGVKYMRKCEYEVRNYFDCDHKSNNIIENVNNKIIIITPNNEIKEIILPEGNYSFDIFKIMVEQDDIINLEPNCTNEKMYMRIKRGYTVILNEASPYEILGFDMGVYMGENIGEHQIHFDLGPKYKLLYKIETLEKID